MEHFFVAPFFWCHPGRPDAASLQDDARAGGQRRRATARRRQLRPKNPLELNPVINSVPRPYWWAGFVVPRQSSSAPLARYALPAAAAAQPQFLSSSCASASAIVSTNKFPLSPREMRMSSSWDRTRARGKSRCVSSAACPAVYVGPD